MFFQGPFLRYLQQSPENGLDAIIQLVNFATDRWVEWDRRFCSQYAESPGPYVVPTITLLHPTGVRTWLGDSKVYGWYRDRLCGAGLVVSALMALEKWMYDEMDASRDIASAIETIFERSTSASLAGVLAAVGRRKPSLLHGLLRPILSCWQLYGWENRMIAEGQTFGISTMNWVNSGEWVFNLVRNWHTLAHRKTRMLDVAFPVLITKEGGLWFKEVRSFWQGQSVSLKDQQHLELLTARLDPANYPVTQQADGQMLLELQWPDHLKKWTEKEFDENQADVVAASPRR